MRFDGYRQWATLQVSHDPTQTTLLVAAVLMVLGLLGSLAVRRRRLWVRIEPPAERSASVVWWRWRAGPQRQRQLRRGVRPALLAELRDACSTPSAPVSGVDAGAGRRIGAGKD